MIGHRSYSKVKRGSVTVIHTCVGDKEFDALPMCPSSAKGVFLLLPRQITPTANTISLNKNTACKRHPSKEWIILGHRRKKNRNAFSRDSSRSRVALFLFVYFRPIIILGHPFSSRNSFHNESIVRLDSIRSSEQGSHNGSARAEHLLDF